MSLLSRLFGGSAKSKGPAPEQYKGFTITPEPIAESGGYRLAARIEKEVDGKTLHHHLIRADTLHSAEEAAEAAVLKSRSLIDQMGEKLF